MISILNLEKLIWSSLISVGSVGFLCYIFVVSGTCGNLCSFFVVRGGGRKEESSLDIHMHFDYKKVVVELICINDVNTYLLWIVLRNSGLKPWLVLWSCLLFNSSWPIGFKLRLWGWVTKRRLLGMEQTVSVPIVDQFNFLFEHSYLDICISHSKSLCWEFYRTVFKSY